MIIKNAEALLLHFLLSIHKDTIKIFVEDCLCRIELLGSIFLDTFEFIFHTKRLIFMCSKCMIRQHLDTLYHIVTFEMLAKSTDILLERAVSLYKNITQPERLAVILQPFGSFQGLLIMSTTPPP